MFEKMKLSAAFPVDLDFQFQKSRLPTFPLQLCLTHNESVLIFGLDCNRPLEKSDPYELSSDFGCYLPLFDNLYFRPKTILSFCLASPPSNACQKSEIFQIWKCLKYIRLSFCPIQTSFQACSRCPSQRQICQNQLGSPKSDLAKFGNVIIQIQHLSVKCTF